ncbi:LysR family transcriptional regulator, partial [Puniceibacterium confluentis]
RNWSDIRVFLEVIRTGSTLAASKVLGIAQPTVARRMDTLEHDLGLRLFERDTRGFRPTAQAQALIPFAESMEQCAADLAGEARHQRSDVAPIRITAAAFNFATTFKAILAEFQGTHPETRFEFIATDRILDLSAGEADIAIRHGRVFDDKNLICRKLSEGTFALYASRDYVRAHGCPTSAQDLRNHSVIVPEGDGMPRQLRDWGADQIDPARTVMACSDWPSLLTTIETGAGIGPIATSLGDGMDDLVRCLDLPDSTSFLTMLLVSPQAYSRKDVKAFTAFFAPRYAAFARAERLARK